MKPILLITPPFTQLNTPYPATPYLKGFLDTRSIPSAQMDLGIDVITSLFSVNGLKNLFDYIAKKEKSSETANARRILALKEAYLDTIEPVIVFLQGKNPTLARLICRGDFLPEASRFDPFHESEESLEWAFGTMGMQDKAKHLATLYLEDLSDLIVECVDENFGFSRYAERLGRSANTFDELYQILRGEPSYIDQITLQLLDKAIRATNPVLVGFSVPFPGNLYSAFRCAQYIKTHFPEVAVSMGGGFPNTELRSLKDPRVFEFLDFITLDDGERPIEQLYHFLSESRSTDLKRTYLLENGTVVYRDTPGLTDYKLSETGTPDYTGLPVDSYISVIEVANPMHSLWSDGRWNKLTMAHGCYWGKCTFCDVSLDYIRLYEPVTARVLVNRMEELMAQTGENGFHFVDEAAPPALMRELALEILRRGLSVSWWTNIRFEKSFTYDLCYLLKASGCIAVSGGLEVASDRLLKLIQKGVTVEQVARVTRNFTENGIMVHSYLMYGYPSQTVQETIDSLEMVRQLFESGVIRSGFWHQFAMTAHSPVGMDPEAYGVIPVPAEITFAHNDVMFKDSTGIDHDKFSFGLKKSLYNYMHGICFDYPLQEWFDFKVPETTIKPDFIYNCLQKGTDFTLNPTAKVVWIGPHPLVEEFIKGKLRKMVRMTFHERTYTYQVILEKEQGEWLLNTLYQLSANQKSRITVSSIKSDFETRWENFELFWFSKPILTLRENGLLCL